MMKKTWVILTVLFIFVISFIVVLLLNNKRVEFNIKDTKFHMLNESNFNSIEIKESCLDCKDLKYKESVIINDYAEALDLLRVVHQSKMEEFSPENGFEYPQSMAIIMYEKESDGINYIFAITISAISSNEAWVYISEEDKYYLCEFLNIDIIKYISDLYSREA